MLLSLCLINAYLNLITNVLILSSLFTRPSLFNLSPDLATIPSSF